MISCQKKTCGEVIIDCDEYGTGACRAPYVSRATTNCAKTCAFCDLNIVGFFLTNNSLRRKKKGFWNQHVVNREFVYPISNKLLPFHVDTHFVLALLKRLNLYKPHNGLTLKSQSVNVSSHFWELISWF